MGYVINATSASMSVQHVPPGQTAADEVNLASNDIVVLFLLVSPALPAAPLHG